MAGKRQWYFDLKDQITDLLTEADNAGTQEDRDNYLARVRELHSGAFDDLSDCQDTELWAIYGHALFNHYAPSGLFFDRFKEGRA